MGLFVKDINKTTEKEAIGQKYGYLRMLLGVLAVSLLGKIKYLNKEYLEQMKEVL